MNLQQYVKGCGVEVGRGEHDRLSLLHHPNCLTVELFEENPYWIKQPDYVSVFAEELPFTSSYLSFVASAHMLEHSLDPLSTLCEWKRVLKIGGFLILALPDKDHSQYPEGVYLDREKPRSTFSDALNARGRVLPEGRPQCEYQKDEAGINRMGCWVGEWTGCHHWAWKVSDIVHLMRYIGLDIIEIEQFYPDKYSFCVVGKKVC